MIALVMVALSAPSGTAAPPRAHADRLAAARSEAAALPAYSTVKGSAVSVVELPSAWQNLIAPGEEHRFLTNDPLWQDFMYYALPDGTIEGRMIGGDDTLRMTAPSPGSRVVKLLINMNNLDILYAQAADRVLYKSIDRGQSWSAILELSSAMPEGGVVPMLLDLVDQDILVVGARSVMLSRDAGATWEAVTEPIESGFFTAVELSLDVPKTLAAGTSEGDAWMTALPEDAAQTPVWNRTHPRDGYVSALSVDTADANRVFLAYREFADGTNGNVFVTRDLGLSWNDLRESGARFPSAPVYGLETDGNLVYAATAAGLLVSSDRGESWMREVGASGADFQNVRWGASASGQRYIADSAAGVTITTLSGRTCQWELHNTSAQNDTYLDTDYRAGAWAKIPRLIQTDNESLKYCRFMPFGQRQTVVTLWLEQGTALNFVQKTLPKDPKAINYIPAAWNSKRVWFDKYSQLKDRAKIWFAFSQNPNSGIRARTMFLNFAGAVPYRNPDGKYYSWPPQPIPNAKASADLENNNYLKSFGFPARMAKCTISSNVFLDAECAEFQTPIALVQGPAGKIESNECKWSPSRQSVDNNAQGCQSRASFKAANSCDNRPLSLIICFGTLAETGACRATTLAPNSPQSVLSFSEQLMSSPTTCASVPDTNTALDW